MRNGKTRSMMRLITMSVCALMLFAGAAAGQSVRYVDDDSPAAGDGLAWATAYKFLQDALTEAAAPGSGITEIRVGQGTYWPDEDEANPAGTGDRSATFTLLDGVSLLGGYVGLGAPSPDLRDVVLYKSIMSGDLASDDLPNYVNYVENSLHVTFASGTSTTAVIDGFVITAGHADQSNTFNGKGAGMFNDGGSPVVSNCSFTLNKTWNQGGAMYNGFGALPSISNCRFEGNFSRIDGSAMQCDEALPIVLNDCLFLNNISNSGSGVIETRLSSLELNTCQFISNQAPGNGAIFLNGLELSIFDCVFDSNGNSHAIWANHNSGTTVVIDGSTFVGNTGGAIQVIVGSLTVTNTSFTNNGFVPGVSSSVTGGAIALGGAATGILTNCSFTGNSSAVVASRPGGAIHFAGPNLLEIIDCSFTSNSAAHGGAIYSTGILSLDNCTFLDNYAEQSGGAVLMGTGTHVRDCTFIGNEATFQQGGALNVQGEVGFIEDCIFLDNTSRDSGALLLKSVSPVVVNRCQFELNTATRKAGAVFLQADAVFTNCSFIDNIAKGLIGGDGGAVLLGGPVVFRSCEFIRNVSLALMGSSTGGGAVYIDTNSNDADFVSCTFQENIAVSNGGAIHMRSPGTMISCEFMGNQAGSNGGALKLQSTNMTMANCLFNANTSIENGGAIQTLIDILDISNCTFVNNRAEVSGGGIVTRGLNVTNVTNCIFWENTERSTNSAISSQMHEEFGGINNFNYSCVIDYDPIFGGIGNTGLDPMFVDFNGADGSQGNADDDLRLTTGSPCVDSGENISVPLDSLDLDGDLDILEQLPLDLDERPRFADDPDTSDTGAGAPPLVDMGVYEFQAACLADTNGDTQVNVTDLLAMLAAWGPCPAPCVADSNSDGQVNVTDLLALLGAWGPCP